MDDRDLRVWALDQAIRVNGPDNPDTLIALARLFEQYVERGALAETSAVTLGPIPLEDAAPEDEVLGAYLGNTGGAA